MKDGLQYFTDTHLTVFALLIFLSWFVIMCYQVIKVIPQEYYDHLSQLPLTEEESSK